MIKDKASVSCFVFFVRQNLGLCLLIIVVQRSELVLYIPYAHFCLKRWKCLSPDDMMKGVL